jgi:sulfite oxidase
MADLWNRRQLLQSAGLLSILPATSLLTNQSAWGQISDRLKTLSTDVPNAEPHVDQLIKHWITPAEQFYIRSHAPAPKVDPESFQLVVEGLVDKPLSISYADLFDDFTNVEMTSTLTCAGNRRTELMAMKPIKGVPWGPAAIGNAEWSGVRLSDVLKKAGVKPNAKHVWFEGLDEIQRDDGIIPFGASIPIEKAFADSPTYPGAMLCNQMNGENLSPDHGYPLRTIVPGFIGARSVKWLGRITVSDRPSNNHYVAKAYKMIYDNTDKEWAEARPIYEYILNSVIAEPKPGSKFGPGNYKVKGYALPPGQKGVIIKNVELSVDNGRTWMATRLTSEPQEYCWQLWESPTITLEPHQSITVRATDSNGKTQPQSIPWNHKGYLMNQWHQVKQGG